MKAFRRPALTAVTAAALALTLAACSGGTTNGGDNTESEGPLVIYSGRGEDLVAPLIDEFTQETGIQTEVRYAGTSEQAQLLLTEGENSPAHVFLSQEAGALGLVSESDLLAELPEDVLTQVPDEYSSDDGTWVGITGRARVVTYDKENVDEADVPDTVEEMVDPKWKGKVGIAPGNASFLSFVTAMRVVEGEDFTKQWLEDLAALEPKTYERNGHILEAVNNGEVELGLINHYYWYAMASEQGGDNLRAQIKFGQPGDIAALVNVTGVGVLQNAAEREDAQEFVNFLLSETGQTYFAEKEFEYPLVDGVDGPEGAPDQDTLRGPDVDLSDLGTVEETAALVDEAGLTVG